MLMMYEVNVVKPSALYNTNKVVHQMCFILSTRIARANDGQVTSQSYL